MEEPEVEVEDATAKRRDVRLGTPERQPSVKSKADEEKTAADDESLKVHRLIDDSGMGMSSIQRKRP